VLCVQVGVHELNTKRFELIAHETLQRIQGSAVQTVIVCVGMAEPNERHKFNFFHVPNL
jgi:hypothetical protein